MINFFCNFAILAVTVSLLTGCASIGPNTIKHDQFDYSDAMSRAQKDQTLLNVVKLRYADMPVFLEVASVINSYSLEGSLSAGGGFQLRPSQLSDTGGRCQIHGQADNYLQPYPRRQVYQEHLNAHASGRHFFPGAERLAR